jgi:hypothetical protein
MKRSFGIVVLLVAYSLPAIADSLANSSVPIALIYDKALLPIEAQRGSFVTPTFKFFDGNKLAGILSGAPPKDNTLNSVLHTLPNGFSKATLTNELATVHITAPVSGQTVLIYVMNGACPPCDHIIEDVKAQLPNIGWSKAHFLVVNIATH